MSILPSNYFQIMLNYLWRLNDDLQKEVDKFKLANFGLYNIGIQIRAPTYRTDKKDEKDHKGMPVPPLGIFAQAAEVCWTFFLFFLFDLEEKLIG